MPTKQEETDPLRVAVTESLILMAGILANPREVTASLVDGWVAVMRAREVTPNEVRGVAVRLLETQTFFPTPADFLKLLHPAEDRDAAEELAWQRILDAVRNLGGRASLTAADFGDDGLTLWVVQRMGWERLCRELTEDNRSIWRAEFMRLFRAGRQSGATASYLPGWFERENLARGYDELTPVLVGRPDWKALPAGRQAPALVAGELEPVSEMLASVE